MSGGEAELTFDSRPITVRRDADDAEVLGAHVLRDHRRDLRLTWNFNFQDRGFLRSRTDKRGKKSRGSSKIPGGGGEREVRGVFRKRVPRLLTYRREERERKLAISIVH